MSPDFSLGIWSKPLPFQSFTANHGEQNGGQHKQRGICEERHAGIESIG
jgi:hypothetical protein